MRAIRCSCGATHLPDDMQRIGRQYGLDGEYMDLGNCPTCGSTICVAHRVGYPSSNGATKGTSRPS